LIAGGIGKVTAERLAVKSLNSSIKNTTIEIFKNNIKKLLKANNLDELFRNATEISIKSLGNTSGTTKIIRGTKETAKEVFEGFKKKGWKILPDSPSYNSDGSLKGYVKKIQSPNGKEILQLRNFQTMNGKNGEVYDATFDLIKRTFDKEKQKWKTINKKEIKFLKNKYD